MQFHKTLRKVKIAKYYMQYLTDSHHPEFDKKYF